MVIYLSNPLRVQGPNNWALGHKYYNINIMVFGPENPIMWVLGPLGPILA